MDRKTLNGLVNLGPLAIKMNDGERYVIDSREMIIVDDIAAHVLCRDDDGKMRTRHLALVCMCSVEPLVAA